jgi:formylglycine-generating enzyme required for sulfatase activity
MIDALITGLSKGLELSAEEIADTLWLALQIEESQPELSVGAELRENSPQPTLKQGEPEVLPAEISTHPSEPEETASNQPPDEPKAGIYPRNPQESLVGSGLSLRVPDAPSLREPLTLARALKPLMRRMPSGSTLVLDEAATTQQIAETGLWLPVLKPTLEPWLDLELVVDEGISMQIWRHTIGELERLLKNYGIFRDVRVWGLIADDPEASDLPRLIQIRRGIGATAKHQSPRSPAELIDPSGRRLILVVSDCVSPQWRDGKLTATLELWAKQGSIAIVQMLPKWLWKRTALGRASEVRLQGLNPGEFNQKLIAKGVSLWDELEETRGVKVPIFTLEPDRVATWAQMLSGKGSTWTAGYVFKLDPLPARQGKDLFNRDVERQSAEQRVQAFRVTASPMARKLAGLLAAAPVISLPIVRLIQETLLKESQQVHVAEVFLGGLLKPLSEINPETNPNYVQYEFIDGVRELLADSVPSGYVLDVVDAVSKYVARKLGISLAEFAAVLRNPQHQNSDTARYLCYFATISVRILRRLGGEYAKFAESLWEHSRPIKFNVVKLDDSGNVAFDDSRSLLMETRSGFYFIERLEEGIPALELVSIPGGSFMMGGSEEDPDSFRKQPTSQIKKDEPEEREYPSHLVSLKPFYISRYPITHSQWTAVKKYPQIDREIASDPFHFVGRNCPADHVSWDDAQEFCKRLSARTGKYYSLPSEAQWEYACRAGSETAFHYGKNTNLHLFNCRSGCTTINGKDCLLLGRTSEVDIFPANNFGLHDMHGNVWEWCEDDWHSNYDNAPKDGTAWVEEDRDDKRVIRGGCWDQEAERCRSSYRAYIDLFKPRAYTGFRVCCNLTFP